MNFFSEFPRLSHAIISACISAAMFITADFAPLPDWARLLAGSLSMIFAGGSAGYVWAWVHSRMEAAKIDSEAVQMRLAIKEMRAFLSDMKVMSDDDKQIAAILVYQALSNKSIDGLDEWFSRWVASSASVPETSRSSSASDGLQMLQEAAKNNGYLPPVGGGDRRIRKQVTDILRDNGIAEPARGNRTARVRDFRQAAEKVKEIK